MNDVPCERCLKLMQVIERLSAVFAESCELLKEANERIFEEERKAEAALQVDV